MKPQKRISPPRRAKKQDRFERASVLWRRGNVRSAFTLFLEAAKEGDESAQVNVGYFFDVGLGTRRNGRRALYWYKRAYEQGSAIAASNIGTMHRDAGKVAKALQWFAKALRRGDQDAALEIGKLYYAARGDLRRARRYFGIAMASDTVTEATQEEAASLLKKLDKAPKTTV